MKSTGLTPLSIAAALPTRGVDYFQWDQIAGEEWAPTLGTDAVYGSALGYPALDLLYQGTPAQVFAQYRNFPHIGYNNTGTEYRKITWKLKFKVTVVGVPATAYTTFRLRSGLTIKQNYSVFDPAVLYRTDITNYAGTTLGTDLATGSNFGDVIVLEIEYTPFDRLNVYMTAGTPRVLKATVDMSAEPALTNPLAPRIDSGANLTAGTGILVLANRLTWE